MESRIISRDAATTHSRENTKSGGNCVHMSFYVISSILISSSSFKQKTLEPLLLQSTHSTVTDSQHAYLHCRCHLPSDGPLRRSTLQWQIVQTLQHHSQHILHLRRRCSPHRGRFRPNSVQFQHLLRRHPNRRWLRRSIR
jgi:hypothetical protein